MPASSTRAPADWAAAIMQSRLARIAWRRQAAQAVVGAEREDDDARLVLPERGGQAAAAAGSGFAADAGIDDRAAGTFPGAGVRPSKAGQLCSMAMP